MKISAEIEEFEPFIYLLEKPLEEYNEKSVDSGDNKAILIELSMMIVRGIDDRGLLTGYRSVGDEIVNDEAWNETTELLNGDNVRNIDVENSGICDGKIKSSEIGEGQVQGSQIEESEVGVSKLGESEVEEIEVKKSKVENWEIENDDVREGDIEKNDTERNAHFEDCN